METGSLQSVTVHGRQSTAVRSNLQSQAVDYAPWTFRIVETAVDRGVLTVDCYFFLITKAVLFVRYILTC